MKPFLLTGAGLMCLTTLVHIFVGGPDINAPIQDSTLPIDVRATAAVVWHVVSVLLGLSTVGLAWLAWHQNAALEGAVFAVQCSFAVLFLGYGLAQLGDVWTLPQWTVFLMVAALMVLDRVRSIL